MDILTNREGALVFWGIVGLTALLITDKKGGIKSSLGDLLTQLLDYRFLVLFVLIAIYETLTILILNELSLWDISQLKSALFWYAGAGIMFSFRLISNQSDSEFFKNVLLDNLKVLVLIEYLAGLQSFSMTTELLLMLMLIVVSALYAYSETDKQFSPAGNFLSLILFIYLIAMLWNSGQYIYENFSEFSHSNPILDIVFPILLTLFFIPFLYLLKIYVAYERVFGAVSYAIEDNKLASGTKLQALCRYHFNIDLLDSWRQRLLCQPVETRATKEGIENSFKEIEKISQVGNSKEVPTAHEGWAPLLARNYLAALELPTRRYHRLDESGDEWWAGSDMLELGEEILPNNMTYYIEGTENAVKELKLKLNVNHEQYEEDALRAFISVSKHLFSQGLDREITKEIVDAISNHKDIEVEFGHFRVSYSETPMLNPDNGYIASLLIKTSADIEA